MKASDSTRPGNPAVTVGGAPESARAPQRQPDQKDDSGPDHPGQPAEGQPEDWQDGHSGEPDDGDDDEYVPA
jgi:hypothetical protein